MSHVFNVTGADTQRAWIEEAIAACSFNFDQLKPGLLKATGREFVDVSFRNLGSGIGGMASEAGWIQVSNRLDKQSAMEVFLMEAAHSVDFFFIDKKQRQSIYDLFHPAGPDSHSWFEPSTYWSQVGEAFMYLFVWAYSPMRPASSFVHKPVDVMLPLLRTILGDSAPPPPPPPLPPNDPPVWSALRSEIMQRLDRGKADLPRRFDYVVDDLKSAVGSYLDRVKW